MKAIAQWLPGRFRLRYADPDWSSVYSFNLCLFTFGFHIGWRYFPCWPYACFNRRMANGSWCWGFGLLQISGRHQLYVGSDNEEGIHADFLFTRIWGGR